MEITEAKVYKCPVCRSPYDLKAVAEKCFSSCRREKTKEQKRKKLVAEWDIRMNELRLAAESPEQVATLLVEHAKRYFGVVFRFTKYDLQFGDQSCTHSAPIGKPTVWSSYDNKAGNPTKYPGWRGMIEGDWLQDGRDPFNEIRDGRITGMTELWDYNRIRGVHMDGCFNGGRNFSGGFLIFLDDFPKMQQKYKDLQALQKKKAAWGEQKSKQNNKIIIYKQELCNTDAAYVTVDAKVKGLKDEISKLTEKLHQAEEKRMELYGQHSKRAESEAPQKFPIPKKYSFDASKFEELQKMFGRRW